MSNNNNTTTKKSFVDSFKDVSNNLATRYNINMHLDFIQEFIKFADNTRDFDLQNAILTEIKDCECEILNLISDYEHDTSNKENTL